MGFLNKRKREEWRNGGTFIAVYIKNFEVSFFTKEIKKIFDEKEL